jgi:hypothetical protein
MAEKEPGCIKYSHHNNRCGQDNAKAPLKIAEPIGCLDQLAIPIKIAGFFIDAEQGTAFQR